MKKVLHKPHLFFFAMIPIAVLLAFVLHDRYLEGSYYGGVITFGYKSIFVVAAVFFTLIGVNYWSLVLLNKKPKKFLTVIHLLTQIIAFSMLVYYAFTFKYTLPTEELDVLNFLFFISVLIFITSIFLHLANFFWSLISK